MSETQGTPAPETPAQETPPAVEPGIGTEPEKTPETTPSSSNTPSPEEKPAEEKAGEKPASEVEPGIGAEEKPGEEEGEKNEFLGAPETDYELPTVPDGVEMSEEQFAEFAPLAKKIGLSQSGVQALVDFEAKRVEQQAQDWVDTQKTWSTTWRKDPELGGTNTAKTLSEANAAIAEFGTPGLRAFFNQGFGNHPDLVAFCAKVGRQVAEPGPGGSAIPGSEPKAREDKFYGTEEK